MIQKNIKKEIKHNDLVIRLYNDKPYDRLETESNIKAFDLTNTQLWIAEKCKNGQYFEMQIDESNNRLEANDGYGMHYEIELVNGRIVSEQLIK
jgi:hypothetical protein